MARCDYRVVSCEGGDQVGKADALLNLSDRFLSDGSLVTYSSFPIYATPFGAVVRFSLMNGLKDFSFSDPLEELKARMSLYAINRLEFMDVLLSNPKYKETVILLDRSPFSGAVTIGYGLATMGDYVEIDTVRELVKYSFELERFMIKKMNLGNCVVQLSSEDRDWKNLRTKEGDTFERQNVQEAAEMVYQVYADKVGKGWKKIITKNQEGWRPREEISNEIYSFVTSRLGELGGRNLASMYKVRCEIGIEEVLECIYKGEELPSGILKKYLKALRCNDKDTMYKYGSLIGVGVGRTCQLVKFKNKGVRKALREIINDNSKVVDIVSEVISKGFVDKFKGAINE